MHMLIAIAGGAHCLELAGEAEGGEGEREREEAALFFFVQPARRHTKNNGQKNCSSVKMKTKKPPTKSSLFVSCFLIGNSN